MLKQNQRSEKTLQKIVRFHLNRPLLMGMIVCFLSISLMTSASAKELRINLTESLDMSNNDKKPKDFVQKAKPNKKEIKKPEKPKPKPAVKKLADVKKKSDMKAKPIDAKKKPADTVPKKSTIVKAKPSPTKNMKTK